jgi:hypothetical protein
MKMRGSILPLMRAMPQECGLPVPYPEGIKNGMALVRDQMKTKRTYK